jgi:AraC family transcriptional regulator
MPTLIHIKNMVCNRCITVVKDELEKLGLHIENIKLGEVTLEEPENQIDKPKIIDSLTRHGFELLDDKKSLIVDKIKTTVIELIHHQEKSGGPHYNYSFLIEEKVGYDYAYLSSLFSSLEGTTLEKYIINQKIERVKELLVYDEMNLSEISYNLGYSSVQHLSTQFKKVTGLTPSHFKKIKENKRLPLDKVK